MSEGPPPRPQALGCLPAALMMSAFVAAILLLATGRAVGDRLGGEGAAVLGAAIGLAVGAVLLWLALRAVRAAQVRRAMAEAREREPEDEEER